MNRNKKAFVPVTPAGTPLYNLESGSVKEAWGKLLEDAAHKPYETLENFKRRGYTVEEALPRAKDF